ncbi:UMF1 family MFS transporter [Kineosphaera limosa]|uniref:Putative major facilitator superfamily transporter n=1 Tax=Kineosphaera limosa NBRC 100340 TaxID=1184609 RepID=K6WC60_9MICO|nr:MFS transporter [Kineosphaera limosa]NYE02747.1 UMF1 family MFS transporter [Kineosphaera limosa]GAB96825.1 putative major facilitator superfamily transporter [Kineosphaera limosa NBRC 100340]
MSQPPEATGSGPHERGSTGGIERAERRILTTPVVAWAAYDVGSAAFNAVITTFVFTVYLTSSAFGPADQTSSALGQGLAVAGLVIALLAPVTGQRADRAGRRTFWLGVNTALVVLCSAGLFFVRPDPAFLWLGVALVALGNIFEEFAGVQYNAMLPAISTPRTIGRVSGLGWGVGYLGGIVLLGMIVVGFINPEVGWFGVTSHDGENIRVAMLLAAAWTLVFSIPVLLVVRDAKLPHRAPAKKLGLLASYKALFGTIASLWRSDRHTLYFLLASAVFRDGLAGVFTFGGIIAAGTFGFDPGLVIVFGIVANVVAGIATISIGALDDRLGAKRVMVFCLVAMCLAGLGIFLFHDQGPMVFWVLGLILCIFVGPVQSASRTFLARLIPPGREGEVFGLYATTGRAVSFLAPLLFAAAIEIGRRVVEPGQDAQYWGILGIIFVLFIGLMLLLPVHPRQQSLAAEES